MCDKPHRELYKTRRITQRQLSNTFVGLEHSASVTDNITLNNLENFWLPPPPFSPPPSPDPPPPPGCIPPPPVEPLAAASSLVDRNKIKKFMVGRKSIMRQASGGEYPSEMSTIKPTYSSAPENCFPHNQTSSYAPAPPRSAEKVLPRSAIPPAPPMPVQYTAPSLNAPSSFQLVTDKEEEDEDRAFKKLLHRNIMHEFAGKVKQREFHT